VSLHYQKQKIKLTPIPSRKRDRSEGGETCCQLKPEILILSVLYFLCDYLFLLLVQPIKGLCIFNQEF
jgi:hypothetical protein